MIPEALALWRADDDTVMDATRRGREMIPAGVAADRNAVFPDHDEGEWLREARSVLHYLAGAERGKRPNERARVGWVKHLAEHAAHGCARGRSECRVASGYVSRGMVLACAEAVGIGIGYRPGCSGSARLALVRTPRGWDSGLQGPPPYAGGRWQHPPGADAEARA